jgi:hypothetical protein
LIFTVSKGSSSVKGVYSRFGISHIRSDSVLRDRIISSLGKVKDANMVLVDLIRPDLIPLRLDNIVENLIWASEGSEAAAVYCTRD